VAGETLEDLSKDENGIHAATSAYLQEVTARAVKEAEAQYHAPIGDIIRMGVSSIRDAQTGMVIKLSRDGSTSAAKPPAQEPVVRKLAPDGISYLLVRTRVVTDSGILSLPPGTALRLVRLGVYTDGLHELMLTAEQVSNDVEAAREAKRADAAKGVVIAPRTVKPVLEPERTTAPRTPVPRPRSGLGTSSGLGVSGGLDMSGSSRDGHK
jgi:hypothetical protein